MKILALILLPLLLSSCVTSSDLDALKRDMQLESIANKREIQAVKDKLAEVSKDVAILKEYSLSAIKDSHFTLLGQTNELSKELQMMRGRMDENKFFLDRTLKEYQTERELLSARITALEKELKDLKSKSSVETEPTSQDAPKPQEETASKSSDTQRLYDDAQIDFNGGKYDEARQKFEKFIKDNPQHNLLPNAMFFVAETYYAQKKYEDAVLGYENFIKKYPKHDKAKTALLKQGYCFVELKDTKTAKIILERVIEKYPRSEEAKLAEKKISEILQKKHSADKTKRKK